MNFLQLAKERYTTKAYNGTTLNEETIEDLKQILRLSPSSINSQPWKFIFVGDKETKEELAKRSFFNEEKVRKASHVVIFCVRNNTQDFEQYLKENLAERVQEYYARMLKPQGDAAVQTWLEKQVYIALGYFLSACAGMNVDSTAMEGIDTNAYDEVLKPEGYKTLFAVAIGNRNPEDSNQPLHTPKWRRAEEEVIVSI